MAGEAGLAQGLLAGWQTGQQYINTNKDREERARVTAQQQANTDRQFGLAEARYKSDDQRDQRNYDRQLDRDKVTDSQFQQNLAAQREDRRASLGMQAASLNLRKQELGYQIAQQKRAQRIQEEQPVVQAFYEGVKNGNFDQNLYSKISKDNPYNPARFYGDDAIKNALEIKTVVPGVLNGSIDYNDPRAINVLNKTLDPYIQRNIGEKVEGSDKTIAKKELAHVGISEDGKSIIPTLRVTYSDGTTAMKPMTDGGSSHPDDDSVTQIPISNITQELAGYSKLVGTLNNPGITSAIGSLVSPKSDRSIDAEYRKALLDVSSDAAKAKAALNKDGLMAPDEVKAQQSVIDQQAEQRRQEVNSLYGKGGRQPDAGGAASSPDSSNDTALFAAFTDEYKKNFGEAPDPSNPKDLQAYNQWKSVMTQPKSAMAPVSSGPSMQKQNQDSMTAQSLREMQRVAQQNKQQQP